MDLVRSTQLDYTKIDRVSAAIARLKGAEPGTLDPDTISSELRSILQDHSATVVDMPKGGHASWYRARTFDSEHVETDPQRMSYPPRNSSGRANHSRTSVLYAASQIGTALAEIGAREGQWYQTARYARRPEASAKAIAIGELDTAERGGRSLLHWDTPNLVRRLVGLTMEQRVCIYLVEAFIAEMFGRRSGGDHDYAVTNAIVDALFEKYPDAGAILYPSVIRRGGLNIAIKSTCMDSSMEYIQGTAGRILRDLDFGLYAVHRTHLIGLLDNKLDPQRSDANGTHAA